MARDFANALGFVLDAEYQRVGGSNLFKATRKGFADDQERVPSEILPPCFCCDDRFRLYDA
jgi:hypothetical protein